MMEVTVDEESGEAREVKEKLIYVARLLADPKYEAMPAPEGAREKIFNMAFERGRTRATYHRYKRKCWNGEGNSIPK